MIIFMVFELFYKDTDILKGIQYAFLPRRPQKEWMAKDKSLEPCPWTFWINLNLFLNTQNKHAQKIQQSPFCVQSDSHQMLLISTWIWFPTSTDENNSFHGILYHLGIPKEIPGYEAYWVLHNF